jgi:hypothetical protein
MKWIFISTELQRSSVNLASIGGIRQAIGLGKKSWKIRTKNFFLCEEIFFSCRTFWRLSEGLILSRWNSSRGDEQLKKKNQSVKPSLMKKNTKDHYKINRKKLKMKVEKKLRNQSIFLQIWNLCDNVISYFKEENKCIELKFISKILKRIYSNARLISNAIHCFHSINIVLMSFSRTIFLIFESNQGRFRFIVALR